MENFHEPKLQEQKLEQVSKSELLNTGHGNSHLSNLFEDAYKWSSEHKLEISAAAGLLALCGAGLIARAGSARTVLKSTQPLSETLSLSAGKQGKFIVQDTSEFGGRIALNPRAEKFAALKSDMPPSVSGRFTLFPNAKENVIAKPVSAATPEKVLNTAEAAPLKFRFEGEQAELGGRIIARDLRPPVSAELNGYQALNAPLHEIPTFAGLGKSDRAISLTDRIFFWRALGRHLSQLT